MIFILIYALFAALIGLRGFFESTKKGNTFKLTPYLSWMGIFVWGDAFVIGFFWFFVAVLSYLLNDYLLFVLSISIFWIVRSMGKTIYWINEQFANTHRNKPENLMGYKFFKNDSIWFIYQIFWQCIAVLSIIVSIYLSAMWLRGK
jgi:hypothetical protein